MKTFALLSRWMVLAVLALTMIEIVNHVTYFILGFTLILLVAWWTVAFISAILAEEGE